MTDIVAEIRTALDWLAEHGAAHGIAGPVVLSGWSAGGHLTAMCLDHPSVVAGLAISGIFELGPLRDTSLDEKLRLTDDEIVTLSPLRLPVVHKPLAITYGTAELPPLVSDSRDLHAVRAAAHAPGALIPVARREPLHHRARTARRGWGVDAAGDAAGVTGCYSAASTAAAMLNSRASPIVSPISIKPTGGSPSRWHGRLIEQRSKKLPNAVLRSVSRLTRLYSRSSSRSAMRGGTIGTVGMISASNSRVRASKARDQPARAAGSSR